MLLILSGCGGDGGTTGVMDGGDGDGDSGGEIPRPLGSVVVSYLLSHYGCDSRINLLAEGSPFARN